MHGSVLGTATGEGRTVRRCQRLQLGGPTTALPPTEVEKRWAVQAVMAPRAAKHCVGSARAYVPVTALDLGRVELLFLAPVTADCQRCFGRGVSSVGDFIPPSVCRRVCGSNVRYAPCGSGGNIGSSSV